MNCLDFRRRVLIDGRQLPDDLKSHADACLGCAEFLERIAALEQKLDAAVAVPIPEGIADRVLLARRLDTRHVRRRWAIAAAMAFVVVAASVIYLQQPVDDLALAAIEHVREEPESFVQVDIVPAGRLEQVLAAQGLALARPDWKPRYFRKCVMRGVVVSHIVFETPAGYVTLLLDPADTVSRQRTMLSRKNLTTVVLPAARGSLSIVASHRDAVSALEQSLVTRHQG